MRILRWLSLCFALVSSTACGEPGSLQEPRGRIRTGGSAIALSQDERIAVATNRSAGVVTILALDPKRGATNMVTGTRELDLGGGSEPWAAVIGADDNTAYVLLRKTHEVVRIDALRKNPVLAADRISVGSEPTDIAISPSGKKLWVANWGQGTLSIITTDPFEYLDDVNLNKALVETGVLGDITSRSALAHPYSLAITDHEHGDDFEETLYATEFFSQALPGVSETTDLSHVDRNRQGFVYRVSLRTGTPLPAIPIAPVATTGFADSDGLMTSCFPNQLYAAALDGPRLYVTGMCTSPRGPLGPAPMAADPSANFKTLFHPAVFAIDTGTNVELPQNGRLLTQVLANYYALGESDAAARMPLMPNDIAFGAKNEGGGSTAYLAAMGADAVFRLSYDASGTLQGIGSPDKRYIDVRAAQALPIGVAVSRVSQPPFVLALNDTALRLSVIDAATESVTTIRTAESIGRLERADVSATLEGRASFATGLNVWSYKGQAWSSCESCHPGGLSDGIVWFFARGPRRTPSTANTYEKGPIASERGRRLMLWGANIDEIHDIEVIARDVSGGVGGIVWQYDRAPRPSTSCRLLYNGVQPASDANPPCGGAKATSYRHNGLNGALSSIPVGNQCPDASEICDVMNSQDWAHIDAFIRSQRAPVAPTNLNADEVAGGKTTFTEAGCNGCHAGGHWSISRLFYQPGLEENGALPFAKPAETAPQPSLGKLRAQTYAVPDALLSLNPAAARAPSCLSAASMHCATYRNAESDDQFAAAYDNALVANDQIRCVLRDVGTFPSDPAAPPPFLGVSPNGAPHVFEYRQDMRTKAQGEDGMNVPSLFGLSVGAPYFHAGNARTLEELFDAGTFDRHHAALVKDFLSDPDTRKSRVVELIAFLLSIDESTPLLPLSPLSEDFCRHP